MAKHKPAPQAAPAPVVEPPAPEPLTATLHGVHIACPSCHLPMVETLEGVTCPQPWCEGFNVRYASPRVVLVPLARTSA